ncbi:MAG: hypothetical protein IJR95_01170, partial [Lachnospiraceae bacterium]|nr:hypothetical protein [Lachnospiraceae bacterium]
GFPWDAVMTTLWLKLVPSLLNAAAAVVVAPLLYHALQPALRANLKKYKKCTRGHVPLVHFF